jgi:catechol-2,3-dioxygenase
MTAHPLQEIPYVTINATLDRLVLSTPQGPAMADFYARAFALAAQPDGPHWLCEGPQRHLHLRPGAKNRLLESHFRLDDPAALGALQQRIRATGTEVHVDLDRADGAFWVADPDGRRVFFSIGPQMQAAAQPGLQARLQHYALRSPAPMTLAQFYIHALGFVPSDWVRDAQGSVTAVFLRTDALHHALAIFRAPTEGFDHMSCETRDWNALRDWADHMASQGILLDWGVGRHGPGNDTFFMVKDPDGNWAEISAELEHCGPERPAGEWPHAPQTLNRWGHAPMRS